LEYLCKIVYTFFFGFAIAAWKFLFCCLKEKEKRGCCKYDFGGRKPFFVNKVSFPRLTPFSKTLKKG